MAYLAKDWPYLAGLPSYAILLYISESYMLEVLMTVVCLSHNTCRDTLYNTSYSIFYFLYKIKLLYCIHINILYSILHLLCTVYILYTTTVCVE